MMVSEAMRSTFILLSLSVVGAAELCGDDPDFLFGDSDLEQTCSWVAGEKMSRCFLTQGGEPISRRCAVACGTCGSDVTADTISTDSSCYLKEDEIEISFANTDPLPDDWIGIYPADTDTDNLRNAEVWLFACGTGDCLANTISGDLLVTQFDAWLDRLPLDTGVYRAHLLRDDDDPFTSLAVSAIFEVKAADDTCESEADADADADAEDDAEDDTEDDAEDDTEEDAEDDTEEDAEDDTEEDAEDDTGEDAEDDGEADGEATNQNQAAISIRKYCFPVNESLTVSYVDPDPQPDNWVGIYSALSNVSDLGKPEVWAWADASDSGTIIFGEDTFVESGTQSWPLNPFIYRAMLLRNGTVPYEAIVMTGFFSLNPPHMACAEEYEPTAAPSSTPVPTTAPSSSVSPSVTPEPSFNELPRANRLPKYIASAASVPTISPSATAVSVSTLSPVTATSVPAVSPSATAVSVTTVAPVTATSVPTASPTATAVSVSTVSPETMKPSMQASETPSLAPKTSEPSTLPSTPPSASPSTFEPSALPSVTPLASIAVNSICNEFEADITVSFSNPLAEDDDWVGIYSANDNVEDLRDPLFWMWACGSQNCQEETTAANLTFGFFRPDEEGTEDWPIRPGIYTVMLLRNGFSPFEMYAEDTFIVARGECTSFSPTQSQTPSGAPSDKPSGSTLPSSMSSILPSSVPSILPSVHPTPANFIRTRKTEYVKGEMITVSFVNNDPLSDDWVGIYRSDVNPSHLMEGELWVYGCGTKFCRGAAGGAVTMSGTVRFGDGAIDESWEQHWSLMVGEYVAILIREGANPWQAHIVSEPFSVVEQ